MSAKINVPTERPATTGSNGNRLPLHAICPYLAMFPEGFVRAHVQEHSDPGEWVFDPFCGRGTTILESLLLGRRAGGSDINPVAYCISRAKAEPPTPTALQARISLLEGRYRSAPTEDLQKERRALPPFFRRAFYPTTLREVLFLRSVLNWRRNRTDRFIAALALGSLHGEMDRSRSYFSNQMPRTICLKPKYSLDYWRKNGLFPKKRRVFQMLKQKGDHRLKGLPELPSGQVRIADARASSARFPELVGKVQLVVTSPPYLNVTRYEEDQWLRLWFLGGEPRPTYNRVSKDDRHENPAKYWQFLRESWAGVAPLMTRPAVIVVRLGAIGLDEAEMTRELTASLRSAFPKLKMVASPVRSSIASRQARSFLPRSRGCLFEVDFTFAV